MSILSVNRIFSDAVKGHPNADVNTIHSSAYDSMLEYRRTYYESKVDAFLDSVDLPSDVRRRLKRRMLQPVNVDGVDYSNFMEEAARRISQSFQITAGTIAELCAERELERVGLTKGKDFTRKRGQRADIILYYHDKQHKTNTHRVEVKNVKMRERGLRGLNYDGDSLIGFFDSAGEFDTFTLKEIERLCGERNGYFYMPPRILSKLTKDGALDKCKRIRPNTQFGQDMAQFCEAGKIK